jgi:two-component sensor histidine kinase
MLPEKNTEIDYKRRFLYGAYVVIIGLAFLATGFDFMLGSRVDAGIDVVYGVVTLLAYRFVFVAGNIVRAAVVLFWISVAMELVYLAAHRVDFNIIFAILIPIIAFIALPRKLFVLNLAFFYAILISFLGYYYVMDADNLFLHTPAYLISYAVAHLFLIAYGVFYSLTIEASITQLKEANRMQTLLLREVHHRVKNNLNLVASILGLQVEDLDDEAMRDFMLQNQRRIESMALLHEVIYTKNDFSTMDMQSYVERLTAHIVRNTPCEHLEIRKQIVPIKVPIDSLIYLGIMINEMLTNSIKHKNQPALEVTIEFAPTPEGYRFGYCDTNRVDTDNLRQGFGFSLIVLAAHYFGSEVVTTNTGNFCYNIPLNDQEKFQCD